MMNVKSEVLNAEKRIRKHIRQTPLEFSPYLSRICKCNVYLKLESEQLTGSFKIRGAANKLLSLSNKQIQKGIVTASSGNHALAVAYTLKKFGGNGIIYLPENAAKSKIESISYYDAPVKFYSTDMVETETHARKEAKNKGMTYISPYNDPQLIGGQGTIGLEISKQLPSVDAVIVPIGGGGLISGIAGYLKTVNPTVKIYGCEPKASAAMSESIKAGRIVEIDVKGTLSDGTSGGIEQNSITFELCKKYVDGYFVISEREIMDSILLILEKHHKLIEGASALAVASLIKNKAKFKGKNVVLLICGSNISIGDLRSVLCKMIITKSPHSPTL
jgi:threonine dehydratase